MGKLNILPENHDKGSLGRFPSWLHRSLPSGDGLAVTEKIMRTAGLHTVCEEAKCPNRFECWSKKTATFLAMGKACTRNCGFCDIDFSKQPKSLDPEEPLQVAESVKQLGLKHVVITMVARDDLPDGGAAHLSLIMKEVRKINPQVTIEVLTSDFEGKHSSIDIILEAHPEIFNHNIETVRSLTPRVRHKATYDRTLSVLQYVKKHSPKIWVKSGIMVGLGETEEQIFETLHDLANAGCQIVTIGQYLQPQRHKLLVKEFIHPDQFEKYADFGKSIGIKHMYCGPFVRSSYNASELFSKIIS